MTYSLTFRRGWLCRYHQQVERLFFEGMCQVPLQIHKVISNKRQMKYLLAHTLLFTSTMIVSHRKRSYATFLLLRNHIGWVSIVCEQLLSHLWISLLSSSSSSLYRLSQIPWRRAALFAAKPTDHSAISFWCSLIKLGNLGHLCVCRKSFSSKQRISCWTYTLIVTIPVLPSSPGYADIVDDKEQKLPSYRIMHFFFQWKLSLLSVCVTCCD